MLQAGEGENASALRITQVREHKGRLLLTFEGLDDAIAAGRFVGSTLFAPRADIRLDAGEYLDRDLVGCAVIDSVGKRLGTVERVDHYPANDMLVVDGALLPMVGAFIELVDIAGKMVRVADLPAGLLNPTEATEA